MKKLIFCIILLSLITFIPAQSAFSYWIWTPKTGTWINPKYAPKPTPKEQLEYALSFYTNKKYSDAVRELQSLLKHYPRSAEAAEAQYYLGIVYETQEKYFEAYRSYQKVIDTYPFSERIQEINEREFKIAEKFMSGEKRKFAGMPLPVENPAIEIFGKVVDNSEYGPLAPIARYKQGLTLMGLGRYTEAEDAFQKVLSNYPTSEWAEAAKYQLALCQARSSQGPEYDQVSMQEAKGKFEEFVREHPDAVLSKEAEKNILELKNKEAASNYNIAVFYEKQNAFKAAKTYYDVVVKDYSDSPLAARAAEKSKRMQSLIEKYDPEKRSEYRKEQIEAKKEAIAQCRVRKQQMHQQAVMKDEEKKAQKAAEQAARLEKKEQARQDAAIKAQEREAAKLARKQEQAENKKQAQDAAQARKENAQANKIAKQQAACQAREQARAEAKATAEEKKAAAAQRREQERAEKEARVAAKKQAHDEARATAEGKRLLAQQEKARKCEEKKLLEPEQKRATLAAQEARLQEKQQKAAALKAEKEARKKIDEVERQERRARIEAERAAKKEAADQERAQKLAEKQANIEAQQKAREEARAKKEAEQQAKKQAAQEISRDTKTEMPCTADTTQPEAENAHKEWTNIQAGPSK